MIYQAQQLRHWSHSIEPDYPGIAQTMRDGAREIERLTTENDVQRLCLDAVQMLCQGERIENLAEVAQQSMTVQDVAEKLKQWRQWSWEEAMK